MRGQLMEWMVRINDQGLVPEPELYRTMYPNNRVERTAPPTASKRSEPGGGATVSLRSDQGASIAYTLEDGPKPRWLVYTTPLKIAAGQRVRARAVRLGFEDSEEVRVEN